MTLPIAFLRVVCWRGASVCVCEYKESLWTGAPNLRASMRDKSLMFCELNFRNVSLPTVTSTGHLFLKTGNM